MQVLINSLCDLTWRLVFNYVHVWQLPGSTQSAPVLDGLFFLLLNFFLILLFCFKIPFQ